MNTMDIYFNDLIEETQDAVLEFYELNRPEDGNFEYAPLFILPCEPDEKI